MSCSAALLAAEEVLAVAAAEEESEAVQVGAEGVRSVGGMADVCQERRGEGGRVGGEPAGDELEGLGEFDGVGGAVVPQGSMPRPRLSVTAHLRAHSPVFETLWFRTSHTTYIATAKIGWKATGAAAKALSRIVRSIKPKS